MVMTQNQPRRSWGIALTRFLGSLICALLTLACSELSPESLYRRDSLYVGGRYVDDGAGQHNLRDQMYVEHLAPVCTVHHDYPLVFTRGQAQIGTVSVYQRFYVIPRFYLESVLLLISTELAQHPRWPEGMGVVAD